MSISAVVVTPKDKPSDAMEMEKYLQYIRECDGRKFKGRYATATQTTELFDIRGVVYQDESMHTEDLYVIVDIGSSSSDMLSSDVLKAQLIAIFRDVREMADQLPITDMYPTAVGITGIISGGGVALRRMFNDLQRDQVTQV